MWLLPKDYRESNSQDTKKCYTEKKTKSYIFNFKFPEIGGNSVSKTGAD